MPPRRAARRGGIRARRGRALREDGGPGSLTQRRCTRRARHGRRETRAHRAEAPRGGREYGARRVRRDACLHGIPAGALAPDQDEQRDRAHRPRDQEKNEGRRDLPGRQLGRHAGVSEAEVHSGARMGQAFTARMIASTALALSA